MPDRHDPKLSMRPPGERKPDNRPDGQQSDDPLVELARVVSSRSSSIGTPAETRTGASQPADGHTEASPLPSEADLARDLETELLNELQASFSMIPEVTRSNAGNPSDRSASVAANEPADEEMSAPEDSAMPQEVEPDSRVAPELSFHPPGRAVTAHSGRGEGADHVFNHIMNVEPDPPELSSRQQEPQQPPLARESQPPQQQSRADVAARPEPPRIKPPSVRRESLASRIARAAQDGARQEATQPRLPAGPPRAPSPPQPQRRVAVRPAPANERHRRAESAEFRSHQPASQPPAEADARPPRQVESRWDPPPDTEAQHTFDPSRFAPVASDSFPPPGGGVEAEAGIPADDLLFDSGESAFFEEAAPAEQFEAVPGYDEEDMLLPYPEDDLAAMQPRRSRRGPLAIAALLMVLVIGGVSVFMLRSGGASNPPQVIAADRSPTKITPEGAGSGEGDSQSKLIYDRVDPGSEVADSQLVVTGDDPIADIPPIPADATSGDVSRVILEGGLAEDQSDESSSTVSPQMPNGGTTVASSSPEPAPIGPKKVRTVVVRPDGTIVSSEAVDPAGEPASREDEAREEIIAGLPPASETPPAPAADENPLLSDDFGAEALDDPAPAGRAASDDTTESSASASIPDISPPGPAPASPPAVSAPTVMATPGSANGPIDVTPEAPSSAESAGLGGGFLVQVSSQRSEETALETFSELQRRYPSILGDRVPNIQRADLGERGVYYRVRVGYPTREQAVRMCENLKAAGGDCLLATR